MVIIEDISERTRISEVVDRLTQTYPTMAAATIAEVVRDMHVTFNGAHLREFVPLLVERKARLALDELSVSYS